MQKLLKGRLSAPEVFLIVTLLVLGVGNEWRGDDAAGLEVARRATIPA